jgi:long-chain acyl-CoA synthetase
MASVAPALRALAGRTVFLTGATGVLGSALRGLLVEAGAHVRGLSRTVIDDVHVRGDVREPWFSLSEEGARDVCRGVDAIVHLAGLKTSSHPVHEALYTEFAGTEQVQALAHTLAIPLVFASSLEVRGTRTGAFAESFATSVPYPAATDGARRAFTLDGERTFLASCVEGARRRTAHADVRSRIAFDANAHLFARKEPTSGSAYDDEVARRMRAFTDARIATELEARARGFGFSSTLGYAKALAEQLFATRATAAPASRVVRLARVLDDTTRDEVRSLLTTSTPLDERMRLDVVPLAWAAHALAVATAAALVHGGSRVVHATCATGPHALTVARARDALDLATRAPITTTRGPERALFASLRRLAERAPAEFLRDVRHEIATRTRDTVDASMCAPFLLPADVDVAARQLALAERQLAGVNAPLHAPRSATQVDWAHTLRAPSSTTALVSESASARTHVSGPSSVDALRPYDTLVHLFTSCTTRYAKKPVFTRLVGDDARELTYGELAAAVKAAAARLRAAGVVAGDRVVLSGANQPDWPIAFFAVTGVGAIPVPVDPGLTPEQLSVVVDKARPRLAIFDKAARTRFNQVAALDVKDMALLAARGPVAHDAALHIPAPDDVASILFTSGTTGEPKGVMLTHQNFCSLVAALGSIFDMHGDDRALSLLPLHHTLEFSCGLLMPLVAGAHVFYVDELAPDRVLYALQKGRITGMVGVPALWQALERKVRATVRERGGVVEQAFESAMRAQLTLAQKTGLDVGRRVFKPLHDALGGHLKILISGGAALPKDTHALFQGIGMPLAEGYGLTETAPVLTVAEAGVLDPGGTVGRPIPGVHIRIDSPDAFGAGEILAKGPNVMKGYFENEAATRAVFTDDGWLRTGDLGKIDESGRLIIVGRAKDVVVTSAGENIYLDDIETLVGTIPAVAEYTMLGIPAAGGGERLALVARTSPDVTEDAAREHIRHALRAVATTYRPAVIEFVDDTLPRTATRKVKRKDVRQTLLERLDARGALAVDEAPPVLVVRQAIGALVGRDVASLKGSMSLEGDLGFDSLYWVELASLLAPHTGTTDPEVLYAAATIAGVEKLVRESDPQRSKVDTSTHASDDKTRLPGIVVKPGRSALTFAQRELYETIFSTTVSGRAHIPWNTHAIVVANHCSHLDTGLVKFALGKYGAELRPLAAKDYFFEGNPLKVAFFESFTNLVPLDRESAAGRAFDQALDVVKHGSTVLLYPEGTRRTDGILGEFKPLVGRLALSAGVPVVPIYLGGTFDALPKGARFPRARDLTATIGPPILNAELRAAVSGTNAVADAREATRVIRDALARLATPTPQRAHRDASLARRAES